MISYSKPKQWPLGALVLRAADPKEPKMLMEVLAFHKGRYRLDYLVGREPGDDDLRRVLHEAPGTLLDPEQWLHGASEWATHSKAMLWRYQHNFEAVARWNTQCPVGTRVRATIGNVVFETTTTTTATLMNGYGYVVLADAPMHGPAIWNLADVDPQPDARDATFLAWEHSLQRYDGLAAPALLAKYAEIHHLTPDPNWPGRYAIHEAPYSHFRDVLGQVGFEYANDVISQAKCDDVWWRGQERIIGRDRPDAVGFWVWCEYGY